MFLTMVAAQTYAAVLSPKIEVEGNKKTKLSYIQYLVRNCLDDLEVEDWTDLRDSELQQCLFDTKLFSEVELEVIEPVISIHVTERWTIIPIPFVRAGQNSNSVGVFLLDTHFLGKGKQAAIGGATGDRGTSLFLSYRDPSINYSQWTASTIINKTQVDYIRYEGDTAINGYTEKSNAAGMAFGHKIRPSLEVGSSLGFNSSHYEEQEPYTLVPGSYRYNTFGFYVDYTRTDYHFYFQEGHKLHAQIATQFSRSDDAQEAADYEFFYDWQAAVFIDHALQLKLESRAIDSDDIRDSFKLGGNLGYRGVEPGSIWARESHSLSIDYKIPVFDTRWGVWTIGPFADYAIFKEYDTASQNSSTAYGAAAYMFLKGIALPGVGIIVGRNDDYLGDFVSFNIGFGF